MITINVTDARELKEAGFSQDELLRLAADRCQQAIIDRSKNGDKLVEVAVSRLTDQSLEKLLEVLKEAGFTIYSANRYSDTLHSIVIRWEL